jgi:tRNA dimethylallyltransferase
MGTNKQPMSNTQIDKKILAILGPTSSGKSDLAVALAKQCNGEIVSADSRQVYKGLDIGSGKITKKEMRCIPHHLLDVASPKKVYSAERYKKDAARAITKILAKKKIPILCGGTGLYIDAVLHDYSFPAVPPNHTLRKKLERKTTGALLAQLKRYDPHRAATIDPYNQRRLVRALEIVLTTKKPVPRLDKKSLYRTLKIGIALPQETLKKKIHARLAARLKKGLITEARGLRENGVSSRRLENLGLEYRYVNRYLEGTLTKEKMAETLEKEIWHYAKRQMTWFKRDPAIHWVKSKKEALTLARAFLKTGT